MEILFQAKEYASRALSLAEEHLSVQEQKVIQELLDIISTEEEQPIT